jgi:hypothetical protein
MSRRQPLCRHDTLESRGEDCPAQCWNVPWIYRVARRPVELVFSEWFDRITDAIEAERRLEEWGRAKKLAFIRGDIVSLQQLAKRRSSHFLK